MDENTKHIVASNLTVAFYSMRQMSETFNESIMFETYENFLSLLDAKFGITERRVLGARPQSGLSPTIAESSGTPTTGKK